MNTLIRSWQRVLFAFAVVIFVSVSVGTTLASVNTTLLSEDFSEGYVPPDGWSSDNYYYGYSYYSSAGNGGYNGSWVFDMYDCDYDRIYSPTVDLSGYMNAGDMVTVSFDVYMEFNSNDQFYQSIFGEGGAQFQVFADDGEGAFWSNQPMLDLSYTSDYYTYDNTESSDPMYDPSTDPGAWRHYTMQIPSQYMYSTFRLVFFAQAYWNCQGGNVAIDNVTIVGSHPQNITVAPLKLDFGSVVAGTQSDAECVTLTNPSAAPVSISAIGLGGTNPTQFRLANGELPTEIPAEGSVDICVTFDPTGNGAQSATLAIADGSDNEPSIGIPLTGIGLAPLIQVIPIGAHNTATKMFAQSYVRLGDTLEERLLVKNIGAGNLDISNLTNISGNFPGEYFISHLPSSPIVGGASDTIAVRFHPTVEGVRDAMLNIQSDATNGTQTVSLVGIGVLPKIVVTPTTEHFDSTGLGDTVCRTINVANVGSDTLVIKRQVISSNDGDFSFGLIPFELTVIPPGKNASIDVCFHPLQAGTRQAALTLFTNIPFTFSFDTSYVSDGEDGNTMKVTVTRQDTGTVAIAITGTGVPFGVLGVTTSNEGNLDSTIIGTQICTTDTIYNRGSEDIKIDSLDLFGPNSSEFTLSGVTLPFVVKAKGYMPITVCSTPSARGLRQASLTVSGTTNGKRLNGTIGLGVFGEAVCSAITDPVAGTPLFGGQKVVKLNDSTLCVTISNCGDLSQVYTAAVADTTNYHVTPSRSGVVLPGQTTTFCVTFIPSTTGELDSKLTVTTSNLPAMNVDLAGTGACAALTVAAPSVPTTNAGGHSTFIVTINNGGNLDWNLGTPVLTQPDSAYRIIAPVPTVVPAGGNIQITIGYDPSATSKTYTAQLSFPNGGPCSDNDPVANWTQTTSTEGVAETVNQSGYDLGQNYPNPASQSTTFSFTTPTEANVSITLNDLTGKLVKQIISGPVSAGEHLVTLDASSIASGTYVYTLDAGGVRLSHFLVLTK